MIGWPSQKQPRLRVRSQTRYRVRPSTPAVFDPRLLLIRSQATRSVARSYTRLKRSKNLLSLDSFVQRCSLALGVEYPLPCLLETRATTCRYSTTSPPSQFDCGSLSPFAMWPAFPGPGLLRRLPSLIGPSAGHEPALLLWLKGGPMRFPRSRITIRWVGAQLYPCGPRAAASQSLLRRRGLSRRPSDKVSPTNIDLPLPADDPYPPDLSRFQLKGLLSLVHVCYTVPSC